MSDPESIKRLRLIGLVEGCTLLTLIGVAVPLKHIAGLPQLVSALGPVHGVAFVMYLVVALQTVAGGGFRAGEIARVFAVSILPGGTFWNDAFLKRKQRAAEAPA